MFVVSVDCHSVEPPDKSRNTVSKEYFDEATRLAPTRTDSTYGSLAT
jgi:hypothetical protein